MLVLLKRKPPSASHESPKAPHDTFQMTPVRPRIPSANFRFLSPRQKQAAQFAGLKTEAACPRVTAQTELLELKKVLRTRASTIVSMFMRVERFRVWVSGLGFVSGFGSREKERFVALSSKLCAASVPSQAGRLASGF